MFGFSYEGHLRFLTAFSIEISLQNKKIALKKPENSPVACRNSGGLAGAVEKGEGGSVGDEEQAEARGELRAMFWKSSG
jgi:hypothetical protein